MPETVYKGGCHCGAVSFEFKTRQGPGELFARRARNWIGSVRVAGAD